MNRLLLVAALLVPAVASAQTLETLSAGAEARFAQSPASVRAALQSPAVDSGPVLQPALIPSPFHSARAAGAPLATLDLAAVLDRNLHVTNYKFGARPLDLGVATDAGFKSFFLTFSDRAGTVLGPLGDLNRLRGDGAPVRIDASTVYNFRASINIFSPVRGSTLHMTPVQGTVGPSHDQNTGGLLDAIRARATLMTVHGEEYWIFYGRDALPGGGGFAPTRSFLFVHMNGLSSKAWPLAEGSLKEGAPAVVDLGGAKVSVLRVGGTMVVSAAD
jgi:hypothetical protein